MAFFGVCQAQSLATLWDMARFGEPTYRGAMTNVQAARARNDQALGATRTQLSASFNSIDNDRSYKTRGAALPPEKDRYNSHSGQLNLTQPLYNYASIVGLEQAETVVVQAEQQLASAEQELLAKLVSAWLDALAARDGVLHTRQQAVAAQRQWEVMQRGGELGASGQPQVEDARAKFDQALADAVSAEMDAHLKQAALEQIVGPLRTLNPPFIREEAILADFRAEQLDNWQAAAEANNPAILAAMRAYEAASAEVRKQSAGHHPTLELVGSYSNNGQAVGGFPGQAGYDIKQATIGLQLNIPIYSGGTQSAKVDEALAQMEKASLDIEAARRTAIFNVKQAWFGWQSAFARARAGAQALKSTRAALDLARRGHESGLKTELDVLQAEQQVRAAQRDYYKGRYDQVATFVKMKATTGSLTTEDVVTLDVLFVAVSDVAGAAAVGSKLAMPKASSENVVSENVAQDVRAESSAAEPAVTAASAPLEASVAEAPLAASLEAPPALLPLSAADQASEEKQAAPSIVGDQAAKVEDDGAPAIEKAAVSADAPSFGVTGQ